MSSHWAYSRINSLLLRSSILTRDSFSLLRSYYQRHRAAVDAAPPSWKQVLLDLQTQNSTAAALLQVDKQMSLIRYHGVLNYLKERRTMRSAGLGATFARNSSSQATLDSTALSSSVAAPARVAFMVTASMKEQLAGLQYTEADIRQLTPLEATLILEHELSPTDKEAQLPALLELEKHRQEEAAKEAAAVAQAAAAHAAVAAAQLFEEQKQHEVKPSFLATGSVIDYNISATNRPLILWYQVLETDTTTGETSSAGLYRTADEAKEGTETLAYFAQRAAKEKGLTEPLHIYDFQETYR